MYLGSIIGGIFLIIKGKNPNPDRYRELNTKRNESLSILNQRNLPIKIPSKFQNISLDELYDLYQSWNQESSALSKNCDEDVWDSWRYFVFIECDIVVFVNNTKPPLGNMDFSPHH